MNIIGLTGTNGAGKGTVVKYLVEHYGYVHYSASEYIMSVAERRKIPKEEMTRLKLIEVGNHLRREEGASIIAQQLYHQAVLDGTKLAIIESLRNTAEVRELRSYMGFYFFAVDASPKLRYERARTRSLIKDDVSFEEFYRLESLENSPDPAKQQLRACMAKADMTLMNDETLDDLYRQIDGQMCRLQIPKINLTAAVSVG